MGGTSEREVARGREGERRGATGRGELCGDEHHRDTPDERENREADQPGQGPRGRNDVLGAERPTGDVEESDADHRHYAQQPHLLRPEKPTVPKEHRDWDAPHDEAWESASGRGAAGIAGQRSGMTLPSHSLPLRPRTWVWPRAARSSAVASLSVRKVFDCCSPTGYTPFPFASPPSSSCPTASQPGGTDMSRKSSHIRKRAREKAARGMNTRAA